MHDGKDILTTLATLLAALVIALVAFCLFTFAVSAHGHGGRTDADGCHSGHVERHCHNRAQTRQKSPQKAERTCVYIYGPTSAPVYIGISNNPERRWRKHSKGGRAFAGLPVDIHSCYSTRADALERERRLIEMHCRPALQNVTHCRK